MLWQISCPPDILCLRQFPRDCCGWFRCRCCLLQIVRCTLHTPDTTLNKRLRLSRSSAISWQHSIFVLFQHFEQLLKAGLSKMTDLGWKYNKCALKSRQSCKLFYFLLTATGCQQQSSVISLRRNPSVKPFGTSLYTSCWKSCVLSKFAEEQGVLACCWPCVSFQPGATQSDWPCHWSNISSVVFKCIFKWSCHWSTISSVFSSVVSLEIYTRCWHQLELSTKDLSRNFQKSIKSRPNSLPTPSLVNTV